MDACAFAFRPIADAALLEDLGLRRANCPNQRRVLRLCRRHRSAHSRACKSAARRTTDAHGGQLHRRLGNRFTICLENGLMLDAGALILALPARYAARALWNLRPKRLSKLAGFRYDSIRRVSLGYRKRDLPARLDGDLSETFPFIISTDQPGRVPDRDHLLIQVGLRSLDDMSTDEVHRAVTRHFGWGASPLVALVDYWSEADLLEDYDAAHCDRRLRHSRLAASGPSPHRQRLLPRSAGCTRNRPPRRADPIGKAGGA